MGLLALLGTAAATVGEGIFATVDKPNAPTLPTAEQNAQQQAQASQAAALAQADALTKRRGLSSTILQNPVSGGNAVTKGATLGA